MRGVVVARKDFFYSRWIQEQQRVNTMLVARNLSARRRRLSYALPSRVHRRVQREAIHRYILLTTTNGFSSSSCSSFSPVYAFGLALCQFVERNKIPYDCTGNMAFLRARTFASRYSFVSWIYILCFLLLCLGNCANDFASHYRRVYE